MHRQGIKDTTSKINIPDGGSVRLVALYWPLRNLPLTTIHRICGDRVLARGENHQSLRADEAKNHEDIIWNFIKDAEELREDEVDDVVEMDVEEGLEASVLRAAQELARILDLEYPNAEQIAEACNAARGYKPALRKEMVVEKKKDARYFGFLVEIDLEDVVDRAMQDGPEEGKAIWEKLKEDKRVIKRPHITIVHSKSLPDEQELWDRCLALNNLRTPPLFKFELGSVVFNDRVISLSVDSFAVDTESDTLGEGARFLKDLPSGLEKQLHITVGTARVDVPPFEGGILVREWRDGQTNAGAVRLKGVTAAGRVKGLS